MDLARSPPRGRALSRRRAAIPPRDAGRGTRAPRTKVRGSTIQEMDLARSPPRGRALSRRRAAIPPRDEALGHPGLKSGAAQSKRWISLEARHEGGLSVDAVLPSLRGTRHSGTPD